MKRFVWSFSIGCALLLAAVTASSAQDGPKWNPAELHASRSDLEQLLQQYESSAGSGAYSQRLRDRAKYEAALIRRRLDEGDFQVGDRISLMVEGEPTLSDTLSVTSDMSVLLPTGEKVSLKHVLRSEVQEKMEGAIGRVVKQPIVRTETYLRIGILGAVGKQGFYELPADALLTDVLMQVGFPTTASLPKIRVERDRKIIWDGEPLQAALTEGRTLDQLSLRAGDVINVPAQTTGKGIVGYIRSARSLLLIFPAFLAMKRVFRW